jgi:hypothetical protein
VSQYHSPIDVAMDLPGALLVPVACVVLWNLSPKLAQLVSRYGVAAGVTAFGAISFGLAGAAFVLRIIWFHCVGHRSQFSELSIVEYIAGIFRLDLPQPTGVDPRLFFAPYICITIGTAIVLWIIAGILIERQGRRNG